VSPPGAPKHVCGSGWRPWAARGHAELVRAMRSALRVVGVVGVALALGVPGGGPAAADPPQGTATAAVLARSVPVGFTVRDLLRTSASVLALGTAGGRVIVARLDPGTLRVTAKAYLPESQHDGLLAAARGRVLLAVSGPHPRLVVLRERDLGLVEEVALPGQPSVGANVAGVGDMAVVGLRQGGVVSVDLRRARVAHSARLDGTDVNVAAATGSVVAVAAGADQIGLDPFVLDPTTLAVRRRAAAHVGYVQGMVGRADTVWVTGAGGPTFVAGTPVDLSGGRRVQATVGHQIPHGVIYVPGEHTVWVDPNGLTCFDRRSGRFLASSPGATTRLPVVEPHRVLTAAVTSVQVWTPTGRCAKT